MLEALQANLSVDINELHAATFESMKVYRNQYYSKKVDEILSNLDVSPNALRDIRKKLLEPVNVDGVEYSRPMEEASRS